MEWFMDATKNENGEWEYTRILSEEEARDILRLIRQEDLEESDLWALPDRYNSLTTEQKTELDTYRQALRDVPATTDPFNPNYPTKPDWL
jgi:hypothetical protein